jgi:TonB family protein
MGSQRLKFIILSVMAHVILLACLSLHFIHKARISALDESIVQTYSVSSKPQVRQLHIMAESKHAITKPIHHFVASSASPQQTSVSNNDNKSIELLSILHRVIADKQIYPQTAIELREAGTVKIGFTLTSLGVIKKIYIAKSSGYEMLDEAAEAAAESVGVVADAKKYLQHDETFVVDVVFVI